MTDIVADRPLTPDPAGNSGQTYPLGVSRPPLEVADLPTPLNSKLPRPARPPRWAYAALVANTLFFGFFFLNFIVEKTSGSPLITF